MRFIWIQVIIKMEGLVGILFKDVIGIQTQNTLAGSQPIDSLYYYYMLWHNSYAVLISVTIVLVALSGVDELDQQNPYTRPHRGAESGRGPVRWPGPASPAG